MNPASQFSLKRVYLDVCVLCRPFDNQQQVRIRLETSAVALILAHVQQTKLQMIVSPTHEVEINAITVSEERKHMLSLLRQLGTAYTYDLPMVRQRAEHLVTQGFGVADAAHMAFAEQAKAEFVTVDDRLSKRYSHIKPIVWCGTPLAYCEKEDLR